MLMRCETYRNADERRYGKKLKKHWRTTVIAGLRDRKKSGSPAEGQRLSRERKIVLFVVLVCFLFLPYLPLVL
jgi:hypothetical protein